MKNIEKILEIKDKVAKICGYKDWVNFTIECPDSIEQYISIVMMTSEFIIKGYNTALEDVLEEANDSDHMDDLKQSISNLKIETNEQIN